MSYNTGLPNVIVNHLDIQYSAMKLRAGTYGRGLWETDLPVITGTLPVELLSFTGTFSKVHNCNDLFWSTASEINCSYFDIMKSNDAKYFSKIAQVTGAGNSTQIRNYMFSDKVFNNSINYYYLNQVDFDGKETPSNIISIRTGDAANSIALFPNPASNIIQFQFLRQNEIYDLELYDILGKQITMQPEVKISADENSKFNISFLHAGVYFLKLTSNLNGDFLYGRFVKK
ncbi:MAG: T9SS type A sorting domain-containing protein [Bacteroidetes bacterium]|nr:T9SS type A sorting domain-containing protein [Bacteroidota bacterium]